MKRNIINVRLSANENFYGCSPNVFKAINSQTENISLYPNAPLKLKEVLANKYNISANKLIIGAGSVRIIENLILTFVKDDEEVLIFDNSFVAYKQLCSFHNKKCVMAKLDNGRCDPKKLLPLINKKTKLIFIANPNNPTGTIISHNELESFLSEISPEIIVAIDEAYSEYVFDDNFPDSIKLQEKYKNLIILHSLSKIYGIAGIRVGFGIADEKNIVKMSSKMLPFTLNTIAEAAAIASIEDDNFIENSREKNRINLKYLYENFVKLGLNIFPSQANFIYLWFDSEKEKDCFYNVLAQNNIIICDMKVFGQPNAVRITIGDNKVSRKIICLIKYEFIRNLKS
ncbi:MAG: aminotransferase class I/II-fold pyridoxal phosphate-dependent enzyme [Bacteroidia bacterium]|nr:aminotransferase class I/II-fold pyridoxal phosphate-dependent enzyme [Bacteroidia bacterium]